MVSAFILCSCEKNELSSPIPSVHYTLIPEGITLSIPEFSLQISVPEGAVNNKVRSGN